MGLMSRIAAKNAAQNTTATVNNVVINTPIAETPAPAPAPVAPTPAPQATAAPATVPAASAAGTPAPTATATPAPTPKKEWTPQDNAQRIIDAYTAGDITLADTMDGEHAAYLISGSTEKIKVAAKALGGRVFTKTGEGENAKYTWILRKDYIDNPELGAAFNAERRANKDARRAEKAAKAAQTATPVAPQTATPVAPQAAPATATVTLTADQLSAIIQSATETAVFNAITRLIQNGTLAPTGKTPTLTAAAPAAPLAPTGSDDNLPF